MHFIDCLQIISIPVLLVSCTSIICNNYRCFSANFFILVMTFAFELRPGYFAVMPMLYHNVVSFECVLQDNLLELAFRTRSMCFF